MEIALYLVAPFFSWYRASHILLVSTEYVDHSTVASLDFNKVTSIKCLSGTTGHQSVF